MKENTSTLDKISALLTFEIGGKLFCVDIKDIAVIINPQEINQENNINAVEPFIVIGVLKIPLINIHKILELKQKDRAESNRILVAEINGKLFAFIAERVENIYALEKEMRSQIEFVEIIDSPFVKGIIKYLNQEIRFIDLSGVQQILEN